MLQRRTSAGAPPLSTAGACHTSSHNMHPHYLQQHINALLLPVAGGKVQGRATVRVIGVNDSRGGAAGEGLGS